MPKKSIYFHGGVTGLAVGSFILPASEVSHPPDDDWYALGAWDHPGLCCVTLDVAQAWESALHCAKVRGAGARLPGEADRSLAADECETGLNFACRRARILQIVGNIS